MEKKEGGRELLTDAPLPLSARRVRGRWAQAIWGKEAGGKEL